MYFHDPSKKECQDFKETYKTISEKLYGIIKVAAIDC